MIVIEEESEHETLYDNDELEALYKLPDNCSQTSSEDTAPAYLDPIQRQATDQ